MASPSVETPQHHLLQAALDGDLKLLKKLGAELDVGDGLAKTFLDGKDPEDHAALHFAAAQGRTHICKYLVQDLGLDVNIKDGKGQTPLSLATLGHHNPTVVFLTENGANPNLANGEGFSAAHYAAELGLNDILRLLISKGAEIEAKSFSGTPLQVAAAHGKKEAVKILLDSKANPNAVSHHMFTPLLNSILAGSYECTSLLLKAGADPNLGGNGETPLGIAASEGKTDVIKCLLNAGANPNVTDFNGLTPLELAALYGTDTTVMALLPGTSQIPTIPDWSLGGIIKHVHSEEGRRQREQRKKDSFLLSKTKGEAAFKRKDYMDAMYWYSQAIHANSTDATVFSNRSLCYACMNEGNCALSDAEACIALRPDWAKAHDRKGVAYRLLKNFSCASWAFYEGLQLDPENKELQVAFREAVEAEVGFPVERDIKIMHI